MYVLQCNSAGVRWRCAAARARAHLKGGAERMDDDTALLVFLLRLLRGCAAMPVACSLAIPCVAWLLRVLCCAFVRMHMLNISVCVWFPRTPWLRACRWIRVRCPLCIGRWHACAWHACACRRGSHCGCNSAPRGHRLEDPRLVQDAQLLCSVHLLRRRLHAVQQLHQGRTFSTNRVKAVQHVPGLLELQA